MLAKYTEQHALREPLSSDAEMTLPAQHEAVSNDENCDVGLCEYSLASKRGTGKHIGARARAPERNGNMHRLRRNSTGFTIERVQTSSAKP